MMAAEANNDRIRVSPKPRAPLSEDQRYELQSLLLKHDKIKPLDSALREACVAAGWQTRIEERVLEALRSGQVKSMKQLERQIVNEALGKTESKDQESGQQIGSGAAGTQRNGAAGLKLPTDAVQAGTKIVREVLEKSVDVKVEQVEDKEWRDWR